MTLQLTVDQLTELNWIAADAECTWDEIIPAVRDEDGDIEEHAQSGAAGTCIFRTDYQGQTITLEWSWGASGDTQGGFDELYDWDLSLRDVPDLHPELAGVDIIDEDGEPAPRDVQDLLYELIHQLDWEGVVRTALPTIPDCEDIEDTDEDSDMETLTVKRDNGPDLRFKGECVGYAYSDADRAGAGSSWSGETGRWTELRLFKTQGGKFVCESIGRTQWQGEHDRHKAAVCESQDEVFAFFGSGWLAKDLYEDAGIEFVEHVD